MGLPDGPHLVRRQTRRRHAQGRRAGDRAGLDTRPDGEALARLLADFRRPSRRSQSRDYRSRRRDPRQLQTKQRRRSRSFESAVAESNETDQLRRSRTRLPSGFVRAQSLSRPAAAACGGGAPERHRSFRQRSENLRARSQLQSARARQSLRRRCELLSVQRRGESGADDHGERVARRRSPAGANEMNRIKVPFLGLLLTLGLFVQTTTAQRLPTDARALNSARVPLLRLAADEPVALVEQVGAIGMTVSDMDRSVEFYARVLSFEKVSDVEVTGG